MEVLNTTRELSEENEGVDLNRINEYGVDVIHRINAIRQSTNLVRSSLQGLMTDYVGLKYFLSIIFDC